MNRSYLIAAGILLLATLWMLSGLLGDDTAPQAEVESQLEAATANTPMKVRVRHSKVQPIQREIIIHGHTAPNRQVMLKAETAGQIVAVEAAEGAVVEQGQALLRIAIKDRKQRLAEARALLKQRELEYQAAKSLKTRGLNAETQVAQALTLLKSAQSTIKAIELDIEHTRITAPFSGVLQSRSVEVGDFLGVGDPMAVVVDVNPMIVTGQVSEQEVGELKLGMRAHARLVTGEQVEGELRYISAVADAATRTFEVELEIPNQANLHRTGVTAEIRVPVAEVQAHHISSALLALDDAGILGVKGVDAENTVQFYPVEIIKAETKGIWLTGLPDELAIITVGQNFVRRGQVVQGVEE